MTALPTPSGSIWRISFRVPEETTEPFELVLARYAGAVSSSARVGDETWCVEGYADAEPDRLSIEAAVNTLATDIGIEAPRIRFDLEPTIDWLTHNLETFPPVIWGRYWVAGTHVTEPTPHGLVPVRIDAGTAFGSGEHPTTGGCLRIMDRLAKRRRNVTRVLDMGCGSGILGIAAARTWGATVTASDIDPESVRVTDRHALVNQLSQRVTALVSNGYSAAEIARRGPYDLIIANILARPLAHLSHALSQHLADGGHAILSGLLTRDGAWMKACHRYHGLYLEEEIEISGWLTMILRR